MIVVDVNVLVAAHMAGHPHHSTALRALTAALEADTVIIPDAVWSGFLRIVTNPRIFVQPALIDEAIAFTRAVCATENYRHLPGLTNTIGPFLDLVKQSAATAALVPDAYIAAIAQSHSCPVMTFDRDFRRFDGVELVELR